MSLSNTLRWLALLLFIGGALARDAAIIAAACFLLLQAADHDTRRN